MEKFFKEIMEQNTLHNLHKADTVFCCNEKTFMDLEQRLMDKKGLTFTRKSNIAVCYDVVIFISEDVSDNQVITVMIPQFGGLTFDFTEHIN